MWPLTLNLKSTLTIKIDLDLEFDLDHELWTYKPSHLNIPEEIEDA